MRGGAPAPTVRTLFGRAADPLLNYALGLSTIERRNHVIGIAIGIVPGTIALVALGSSVADPGSPGFLASLAAVLLLVAVSTLRARSASPPPSRT